MRQKRQRKYESKQQWAPTQPLTDYTRTQQHNAAYCYSLQLDTYAAYVLKLFCAEMIGGRQSEIG